MKYTRKISPGLWGVIALLGLLLASGVFGQLQQSGGPGSSVNATQTGTWTVQPGNTANTTAWKVDGSGVTQPVSGTFWQATQPVSGTFWQATQPVSIAATLSTAPKTSCGTTAFTPAWAAIPTSTTALTATTSCVLAIMVTNTNASAQTVTVTDGQGSPITVLQAFSVPANSELTLPFYGSQMTSGIKWSAGGTGMTGTVVAYQ